MTDIIIIGGGPAGLSAAIYAKRAGFSVIILDKGAAECQLTKATEVENYLGFESISGLELHAKFVEHVKHNDIQIIKKAVVSVKQIDTGFIVNTRKESFESKYLIIAKGRSHKHMGVEGEEKFIGAGVSYCATCDGFFFKDKEVAVIGGGDSALSQAIYLSAICKKVYLIHRRDTFRAANYLIERAKNKDNIEFILDSTVQEINGEMMVNGITYLQKSEAKFLQCSGVFAAIGERSNMQFSVEGLNVTPENYIITDSYCRTNIPGLYAIGDIRNTNVCQVITAVADGAIAIEGILKS